MKLFISYSYFLTYSINKLHCPPIIVALIATITCWCINFAICELEVLVYCFFLFLGTTKNINNTFMDLYSNIGRPCCNICKNNGKVPYSPCFFSNYTICYLLGNCLTTMNSKLNMILYMLARLCIVPFPLLH